MFNFLFRKLRSDSQREIINDPENPLEAHPICHFVGGVKVVVIGNCDQKTCDMGFREGVEVKVIRNRPGMASMLVELNGERHYIMKHQAQKIKVR